MLRLIAVIFICALAALWVEPDWDREERRVSLRLRRSSDVSEVLSRALDSLRGSVATKVADEIESRLPSVGSKADDSDQLTEADRARLDRLVEEKTRD